MDDVFVRSGDPFNYDTMEASDASGLKCEDESLALQSAAEECDINTIVKRFGITGQLPTNLEPPRIGDFTGVVDFQSAMNAVVKARETFDQMPADIRYRFGNDPQAFVSFCTEVVDGKLVNADEMKRLGLRVPVGPVPATLDDVVEAVKAVQVPGKA